MAIVSISKATKLVEKSRATIYKLIQQGKLCKSTNSVSNIQGIDTSEFIRFFASISDQSINTVTSCSDGYKLTTEIQSFEQSKFVLAESKIDKLCCIVEEKSNLIAAQKNTLKVDTTRCVCQKIYTPKHLQHLQKKRVKGSCQAAF